MVIVKGAVHLVRNAWELQTSVFLATKTQNGNISTIISVLRVALKLMDISMSLMKITNVLLRGLFVDLATRST